MGCWGERHFPNERSNGDMFAWSCDGSIPTHDHPHRGMQRGRAADPLAKIVWYYHTHLAVPLSTVRCPKGSQRKRVTDPHLAVPLSTVRCPKGSPCLVSYDTSLVARMGSGPHPIASPVNQKEEGKRMMTAEQITSV